MIVYFTGTGNSRYCAQWLAHTLGDEAVDCFRFIRDGIQAKLTSERPWVFVALTYGWQLPRIFAEFLRSGSFAGSRDAYFVMTCGSEIGNAGAKLGALCARKDFNDKGVLQVVMPENYIALSDAEENRRVTQAAEPQIDAVIEKVQARAEGDFNRHKGFSAGSGIAQAIYQQKRKTKGFTVSAACINCGLCARQCPVSAIEMRAGRPVWIKETCTTCLGCLHRCPTFAIQYYGYYGQTEKHGKFVHPKVKL